jgi:hypothetical protein
MHFSKSFDTWWRRDTILKIGPKVFTRERAVRELGISSFRAASNLQRAIDELNIGDIRKLAKTTPHDLLAVDGVGERAVFVAMCAIDANGGDGARWIAEGDREKRSRVAAA